MHPTFCARYFDRGNEVKFEHSEKVKGQLGEALGGGHWKERDA